MCDEGATSRYYLSSGTAENQNFWPPGRGQIEGTVSVTHKNAPNTTIERQRACKSQLYLFISIHMFAPQKFRANTSNYTCVSGVHYQSTRVAAAVETAFTPIIVKATIQFRTIIKQ